jgi:glycosyltransferase involved in cell wall biosynthesis
MDTRPTVAHFATFFLRQTATFIYNQVSCLSAHRSIVLTLRRGESRLYPFDPVYVPFRQSWLQLIVSFLESSPFGPMRPSPLSIRYFNTILKREKPVLMHGHFGPTSLYLGWLKKYYQIPVVVTFHGKDATAFPKRLSPKRRQWMFEVPDKILVVSDFMKKQLAELGADADKIEINRVGIDMNKFEFHPPTPNGNQVHFLHVSGFTEKKGVPILIPAFAQAVAVDPRLHLTLVGSGPDYPLAEKLVGELGIQDKVTFLGFVPNQELAKVYQRSHLFVHPSRTARSGSMEGIPTVIMEAMATGLPVLATEHAGIPELVEHGRSGYLVPENDIPALAHYMLEFARQEDRWAELGWYARQRVEQNHNVATQISKLEDVYQSIAATDPLKV